MVNTPHTRGSRPVRTSAHTSPAEGLPGSGAQA